MPLVEKNSGGRVRIRSIGDFVRGDREDVTEEQAEYLCEERGDFERVEATDVEYQEVDDSGDADDPEDPEDGRIVSVEEKTVDELREMAREADISGRSSMTKDELIEALRKQHEERE